MSNAFICDICNNYYKNNDHTTVGGIITDHKKRSRTIRLNVFPEKEINNRNYYNEIDHVCRDCLLKLLASAYPELKFFSITNAEEKINN